MRYFIITVSLKYKHPLDTLTFSSFVMKSGIFPKNDSTLNEIIKDHFSEGMIELIQVVSIVPVSEEDAICSELLMMDYFGKIIS